MTYLNTVWGLVRVFAGRGEKGPARLGLESSRYTNGTRSLRPLLSATHNKRSTEATHRVPFRHQFILLRLKVMCTAMAYEMLTRKPGTPERCAW